MFESNKNSCNQYIVKVLSSNAILCNESERLSQ